jgi:hypothetical protein
MAPTLFISFAREDHKATERALALAKVLREKDKYDLKHTQVEPRISFDGKNSDEESITQCSVFINILTRKNLNTPAWSERWKLALLCERYILSVPVEEIDERSLPEELLHRQKIRFDSDFDTLLETVRSSLETLLSSNNLEVLTLQLVLKDWMRSRTLRQSTAGRTKISELNSRIARLTESSSSGADTTTDAKLDEKQLAEVKTSDAEQTLSIPTLHTQLEPLLLGRMGVERQNSFLTNSTCARRFTYRSFRDMRELRRFAVEKGLADGFFLAPIWNKELPELLGSLAWQGRVSTRHIQELSEMAPGKLQFSTSALNVLACLSVLSMESEGVPVTLDAFHGSGFDLMKAVSVAAPPDFLLLSNAALAFARHEAATEYRLLLSVYADEQRLFKRTSTKPNPKERLHIVPYSSSHEGLSLLMRRKKLPPSANCRWTTIEEIASGNLKIDEGESVIVWGGLVEKYAADTSFSEVLEGRHRVGVSLFCHVSLLEKPTLLRYFSEAFVGCWNKLARNQTVTLDIARQHPEYEETYLACLGLQ